MKKAKQLIRLADSSKFLDTLPDNCFDAIVTDPPYNLIQVSRGGSGRSNNPDTLAGCHGAGSGGFMGMSWDATGISFDPEFWAKCYRVLKPGGHLLSFGGTRTWHRIAVAIEDAGFELRDTLLWMYGSGFPKSLDMSKAIDKRGGYPHLAAKIGFALRRARERRSLSVTRCDQEFCGGTTNWSWYEGRPGGQRAPTPEIFRKIAEAWPEVADFARLVDEAEREVIGRHAGDMGGLGGQRLGQGGGDVTVPATEAARKWEGFGSALKPAYEPILMFRKPLSEPTLAANILRWGTGGLNIDACRLRTSILESERRQSAPGGGRGGMFISNGGGKASERHNPVGRWPANLILDETAAEMLDAEVGDCPTGNIRGSTGKRGRITKGDFPQGVVGAAFRQGDRGGPSRYFYTAKSSRLERELGLLDLEPVSGAEAVHREEGSAGTRSPRAGAGRSAQKVRNLHPTVKPLSLMQWLVVLVTPPDGKVLDPFCGTGTTIVACKIEGFSALGVDMEKKYVEIARAALKVPTLRRAKSLKDAHREERQDRRDVEFDAELLNE